MNRFEDKSELITYLGDVFDLELNLYTQKQLMMRMRNTFRSLGNAKTINRPKPPENQVSVGASMFVTGIVGGILTAIVTFIVRLSDGHGFFKVINALWTALIIGVVGVLVFAFTVGALIGYARKNKQQKLLDKQHEANMAEYRKRLAEDKSRVERETAEQARLANDIRLLNSRMAETESHLKEMYDYDILEPDYRNIYAVSSIFGYLKKGRTNSLIFDAATGDKGAYNLYENERRQDRIITNTEEILKKLDQVMESQYMLAEGLRRAAARIDSLSRGVGDFIYDARAQLESIENSQALIAYNTERTAAEAEMLSWIALMR